MKRCDCVTGILLPLLNLMVESGERKDVKMSSCVLVSCGGVHVCMCACVHITLECNLWCGHITSMCCEKGAPSRKLTSSLLKILICCKIEIIFFISDMRLIRHEV